MVQIKLRAVGTIAPQRSKISAKTAAVAVKQTTRASGGTPAARNAVVREGGTKARDRTKARARASGTGTCVVVQTYGNAADHARLNPEFTACKVRGGIDADFSVLRKIHSSGQLGKASVWGILPLEFEAHTALSASEIIGLASTAEHDFLYCAPEPESDALFHNVWIGTEAKHSGCMELAQPFLEAAGIDREALWKVHPLTAFASPSFLIAKSGFWTAYVSYVDEVLAAAREAASPALLDMLSQPVIESIEHGTRKTYLSLITDNLLSLFIVSEGARFNGVRLPVPKEDRVNVHLRLLREMREVALKTRSRWLAACWVNYRNLYLGQTRGQEWCRQYLRLLTPIKVDFASGSVSASNDTAPANT